MNDNGSLDASATFRQKFERAVAIISLDAEQMWGYLDHLDERRFCSRYPDVLDTYDRLLGCLCDANISATWLVVGGMSLSSSAGACDPRMVGLPRQWSRLVPSGDETDAPLWYRKSFVRRVASAFPRQEVGLHGGLTHMIWTDPDAEVDVLRWELATGVRALQEVAVTPRSFSFPRNQEAHHELLPCMGVRCYRGRAPVLAEKFGRTLPAALLRVLSEIGRSTPPPVWPYEYLPGLWNIPASLFLYPIGHSRTKLVPLRTRVERFRLGVEAAVASHAIFHFCLHPANLAESKHGFSMFEEIIEYLLRAREAGDIEVRTMSEVASRMEHRPVHDSAVTIASSAATAAPLRQVVI